MRKTIAAAAIIAGVLGATTAPAAAGKPARGCPAGFDLGAKTADQFIGLPRIQRSIAEGVTTEEDLRAGLAALDTNGDGVLCVKAPGENANTASQWPYLYLVADNVANRR